MKWILLEFIDDVALKFYFFPEITSVGHLLEYNWRNCIILEIDYDLRLWEVVRAVLLLNFHGSSSKAKITKESNCYSTSISLFCVITWHSCLCSHSVATLAVNSFQWFSADFTGCRVLLWCLCYQGCCQIVLACQMLGLCIMMWSVVWTATRSEESILKLRFSDRWWISSAAEFTWDGLCWTLCCMVD